MEKAFKNCGGTNVTEPPWMNITVPTPPPPKPCTPYAADCGEKDTPAMESQTVDDKPVPCKTRLDVVIALDSSGSLGSTGWASSQQAANKIVSMLDIGKSVKA